MVNKQISSTHRKKIQYLMARRATLELEILLERFWKRVGQEIDDLDLPELERILLMEDMDLLDICMKRKPIPTNYHQKLFQKLLESVQACSHDGGSPS